MKDKEENMAAGNQNHLVGVNRDNRDNRAAVWSRRREPTHCQLQQQSESKPVDSGQKSSNSKLNPQSQSPKFQLKLFWTFCAKLAKLGFPIFFASRPALRLISQFLIYMYGLYYTWMSKGSEEGGMYWCIGGSGIDNVCVFLKQRRMTNYMITGSTDLKACKTN